MKHNQSSEDYLECILLLSRETQHVHRVDVARKIGVSQPAVQKAIKILENGGYVEFDGMHIFLTLKGEEYAGKIYERHCIIKDFLLLHGVNGADADNDACEMEHVISETTFEMMKAYVSASKN
ncbi:MAG: metal-dependent transcriptional regulator [Clostridia bacterium]|nr:metal-dependent transcriptional regulator [Clostridia bacterium]